jgi:nucleoside 2-deoxyribosyltransferase
MRKMKIYLAAPLSQDKRNDMSKAVQILREHKEFEVYAPVEHTIPNAWDYPNNEWGLMVFTEDIQAIQNSDYVVLLSYGRQAPTAGATWEAGYAFGLGKMVIVVEMLKGEVMSLMVANGRYATVKGLEGLKDYDWDTMPKSRTMTEQK